jgi:hypothetical protein
MRFIPLYLKTLSHLLLVLGLFSFSELPRSLHVAVLSLETPSAKVNTACTTNNGGINNHFFTTDGPRPTNRVTRKLLSVKTAPVKNPGHDAIQPPQRAQRAKCMSISVTQKAN